MPALNHDPNPKKIAKLVISWLASASGREQVLETFKNGEELSERLERATKLQPQHLSQASIFEK